MSATQVRLDERAGKTDEALPQPDRAVLLKAGLVALIYLGDPRDRQDRRELAHRRLAARRARADRLTVKAQRASASRSRSRDTGGRAS